MENFESGRDTLFTKYARMTYMEAFFIIGATGYISWHWVYTQLVSSEYDQFYFRIIVAISMLSTGLISMWRKWSRKRLEFAMYMLLISVYTVDTLIMCRYNPGSVYHTLGMYILGSIMVIGLREIKYVVSFCAYSLAMVLLSQLYYGNYLAGTVWFHMIGLGTIFFYGTFFQLEKNREYKKYEKESYLHSRVEEVSNIGGWYLDLRNGEFWVSPQIENIWNIKADDSFKSFEYYLGSDNYQKLVEAVKKLKSEITPFDLEFEIKDKTEITRYFQFTGRAFEVEKNQCVGLIGTISDISEMKYLEQTVESEREKALVSSKLSALGDLASGMAHEINNPLTVIFGAVKKIKKDLTEEEKNKLILRTESSVNKITRIITELQRASAHQNVFDLEYVDLNNLINDSIKGFSKEFKDLEIDLRLNLPKGKVPFKAAKTLFSQVVNNLISNSVDAIKDKEIKWISVSVTQDVQGLMINISDSGDGISDEISDKIMDPFFSTKQVGSGTGLGLSTCYNIVKQHGGNLYYDKNAKNTSFVIEFLKNTQQQAS